MEFMEFIEKQKSTKVTISRNQSKFWGGRSDCDVQKVAALARLGLELVVVPRHFLCLPFISKWRSKPAVENGVLDSGEREIDDRSYC